MAENSSFPCFVADCSFIISYLLSSYVDDEPMSAAKEIEELLNNNGQIYVPGIFWFEVNNVLCTCMRPNSKGVARLTQAEVSEILSDLMALPIYTDPQMNYEVMIKTRDLAQQHNLTFYDACYLEMAKRYDLLLKTFDKKYDLK